MEPAAVGDPPRAKAALPRPQVLPRPSAPAAPTDGKGSGPMPQVGGKGKGGPPADFGVQSLSALLSKGKGKEDGTSRQPASAENEVVSAEADNRSERRQRR